MLRSKVNAPRPRIVQQQLLAVGWDQPVSAAPLTRVGPATDAKLAAASKCSNGGDSAADGKDCDCRFHAIILRQSQYLGKSIPCDDRNFLELNCAR